MPKKGEKFTAPDGKTYVGTEGGNWREYVNGKATSNVVKGNTFSNTGAAAGAANPYPLKTANDIFSTTQNVAKQGQIQGNQLTNPNQVNPFGSQNVTYDPVTGQPTVNQTLSEGNQNVLGGIQSGAAQANDVFKNLMGGGLFGNLNGTASPGEAPLSTYEQSLYNKSMYGVADQKKREGDQLAQTLANRGIPVGSDLYNDQMKQFDQRYDKIKSDATDSAIAGGQSMGLNLANSMSTIGQGGFMNPNFQGFQAVNYNQADPTTVFGALSQQDLGQQQINLNKKKSGGGGGGGGGSPRPVASPFQ